MISPVFKAISALTLIVLSAHASAQEGFIPVSGDSKLHYRVTGAGKDTLVVPDGGWQFPYYKQYGNGVVFIIYDTRNRGYSESTQEVGAIYDVEDLEAVRKFFKIGKINVAGWSYLGGVAALYGSNYPEYTRSIIQTGPIPMKKGEHFDVYLKSTMERRSKPLDDELKASGN